MTNPDSPRNLKILKRRELSVKRAASMHKLRMQANDTIATAAKKKLKKYYIGCSGWFYWDWRGKFYPQELKTNHWFAHYQQSFNTVELNAPFYTWPTIATVKAWKRQAVKKDFIYTVKVPELITHVKQFKNTSTLIKDFQYIDTVLPPHMGCFLFQFPPSYKYSKARLHNILRQLNPQLRNVIEFRHESWWTDSVFKAFTENNIIFCSCSSPKLPDELIKTSDDVYIRLHGKAKMYRYNYSQPELEIWSKRIKASKAKTTWVYFNNDFDCHSINNAKHLIQLLK